MSGARVSDRDHGYRALLARVAGMKKQPRVEVGILEADGGKAHGGGVTVADVATFAEFGTETEPERSFLRAWFDEHEDDVRQQIARLAPSVVHGGRTPEQVLELVGLWAVGEIQKRIAQGVPPPNAPSTIAQKGSSTPLVDTGVLRSSVSHRVAKE